VAAVSVGVHLLGAPVALRGILGERAQHDRVEVVRHLRPQLRGRHRHFREVLHRDLERRVPGERHLPRQQLVEDDTDRVEV
jgi:hypothetical protein